MQFFLALKRKKCVFFALFAWKRNTSKSKNNECETKRTKRKIAIPVWSLKVIFKYFDSFSMMPLPLKRHNYSPPPPGTETGEVTGFLSPLPLPPPGTETGGLSPPHPHPHCFPPIDQKTHRNPYRKKPLLCKKVRKTLMLLFCDLLFAMLRILIRDPVPFWPLDLDPGSWIPNSYF